MELWLAGDDFFEEIPTNCTTIHIHFNALGKLFPSFYYILLRLIQILLIAFKCKTKTSAIYLQSKDQPVGHAFKI